MKTFHIVIIALIAGIVNGDLSLSYVIIRVIVENDIATATIVDPQSCCSANAELYRDTTGVTWSFMLNLTDISYGVYGNNKFYMGAPQSQTERFSSLENAERAFQKLFQAKTGNKWPLTTPFIRKKGKYFLVELDDGESERTTADVDKKVNEKKEHVVSKLPKEVQNIVQLICDPEVVTREMASLNVDMKRFPLGKLSKAQISQGYNILQRLSAALEEIEELTKTPAVPAKAAKAGSKSRRKGKAKAKGPVAAIN
ncbi:unnamed protein product [Peronospora destructor]|uniref:NAD(+) ADP-ribosyltransferase n=1 Tax=Peronospora destructor TaxID=86335 RepID=A0AAV0T7D9_9STRA|nr:unnamed protein product [Peronospora destructor]